MAPRENWPGSERGKVTILHAMRNEDSITDNPFICGEPQMTLCPSEQKWCITKSTQDEKPSKQNEKNIFEHTQQHIASFWRDCYDRPSRRHQTSHVTYYHLISCQHRSTSVSFSRYGYPSTGHYTITAKVINYDIFKTYNCHSKAIMHKWHAKYIASSMLQWSKMPSGL